MPVCEPVAVAGLRDCAPKPISGCARLSRAAHPGRDGGKEALPAGTGLSGEEPGASGRIEPWAQSERQRISRHGAWPGGGALRELSLPSLPGLCSGLAPTHVPHLRDFCSAIGAGAAASATSGDPEWMPCPAEEPQRVGSRCFCDRYFPQNCTRRQAVVPLWSSGVTPLDPWVLSPRRKMRRFWMIRACAETHFDALFGQL